MTICGWFKEWIYEKQKDIEIKDGWSAKLWLAIDTNPSSNQSIYDVQYLNDNLPDEKAVVNIENLVARYTAGDTVKEFDFSHKTELNYRLWFFYKNLAIDI